MSAIANPRPSSRLTRAERMAAHYAAGNVAPAPLYKLGDDVVFEGRASKVVAVSDRPGILTVSNYAGTWIIADVHPALAPA